MGSARFERFLCSRLGFVRVRSFLFIIFGFAGGRLGGFRVVGWGRFLDMEGSWVGLDVIRI